MMPQQKKNIEAQGYVPRLGDRITFAPSAFLSKTGYEQDIFGVADYRQTGEVCYINWAHRYFRVVFYPQGEAQYECFKF